MTRFQIGLFALSLLASGLAAEEKGPSALAELKKTFGPPVVFVSRPVAPPTIDGKLDDESCAKAEPVTLGYLFGGWDAPTQKTEARVLEEGSCSRLRVARYGGRRKVVAWGDALS